MSYLKNIAEAGKKQVIENVKQTVKQKKVIVKQKPKVVEIEEIEPFINWEKIAKSSEFKRLIYLAITGSPTRATGKVITQKLNKIKKLISGEKNDA